MIKISPYYRTEESLNKAEEPFKTITRILERLYLEGVNGKKDVSYSFKDIYAVSCMRDFAEDLAKKQTTFVSRLNYLWGSLMHPNKQFSNSFESYGIPYERYQGLIFGGVYYVLAKQKSVSVEHLDLLSSFVSAKAEALPYFNVYKEAAKNKCLCNSVTRHGHSQEAVHSGTQLESRKHKNDRLGRCYYRL